MIHWYCCGICKVWYGDGQLSQLTIINQFKGMDQQKRESVKYRLIAHVLQLNLNKDFHFHTKVVWKRNVNKTETQVVPHQAGTSFYDEKLELQLELVYNQADNKFQPKMTEFAVLAIYQGNTKSAGYAKFDAAAILQNTHNQTLKLPLQKSPDPNATLQLSFDFEVLNQCRQNMFNELSVINPLNESSLSVVGFQEDQDYLPTHPNPASCVDADRWSHAQSQQGSSPKQKQKEGSKIDNILQKFESRAKRMKSNSKQSNYKQSNYKSLFSDDQNTTKNQTLEISCLPTQNEERLRLHIAELENQLQLKSALIADYERRLSQAAGKIEQYELKLELSQQKLYDLAVTRESIKVDHMLVESERKFRDLYLQLKQELKETRDRMGAENMSNTCKFTSEDEVPAIDETPQFQLLQVDPSEGQLLERIQLLQRENIELQTKIAEVSHNMAQLFNAAYDYGGPKLLDFLQGSIGLTELQA